MSSPATPLQTLPRRRSLILRDTLVFLALCGVTIALFLVTLLLFRSFEYHREDLGRRWAQRGRTALQQGRPTEAVAALRTALTYREALPEQLLLAQALAAAGRTEEARNYFLTLRESQPGDGFLNLQLARLTRQQGDAQQAINYYRASIFGDWEGDGALRRRAVRLELADYLAGHGDTSAARDEILIAAGNAPETPTGDVLFGDRLAAINDAPDAFNFYTKSLKQQPHQRETLAEAGRLAYALGNYTEAYKLLTSALAEKAPRAIEEAEDKPLSTLAAEAHRAPELSLSRELPASERAEHILLAAAIAQRRLAACVTQQTLPPATPSPQPTSASMPPVLQILRSRWSAGAGQLNKRALERDATLEDNATQLIDDTERQTLAPCGPPAGDDALLLRLAAQPHPSND